MPCIDARLLAIVSITFSLCTHALAQSSFQPNTATSGSQTQTSLSETNPACNADFLPAEGRYEGPQGLLDVIHVDGNETVCPTLIQFRLHLHGGMEVRSAMLGQGGSWSGAGMAVMQGSEQSNGLWHLSAEREASTRPFIGIDFARTVWLTGYLVAFPMDGSGTTRQYGPFTLEGGRAPECMCNRIRSERDWEIRIRETYLREDIRAYAIEHNLRSIFDESHYYYRDGSLHRFEGDPRGPLNNMTYEDLVDGFAIGELAFDESGEIQVVSFPEVSSGAGLPAYAFTDVDTCEVTPPDTVALRTSCDPVILYRATMAHEQRHEAMCLMLRDRPTYVNTQGETVENSVGRLYSFASEDPVLHGDDEAVAYAAGIAVMEEWLSEFCSE